MFHNVLNAFWGGPQNQQQQQQYTDLSPLTTITMTQLDVDAKATEYSSKFTAIDDLQEQVACMLNCGTDQIQTTYNECRGFVAFCKTGATKNPVASTLMGHTICGTVFIARGYKNQAIQSCYAAEIDMVMGMWQATSTSITKETLITTKTTTIAPPEPQVDEVMPDLVEMAIKLIEEKKSQSNECITPSDNEDVGKTVSLAVREQADESKSRGRRKRTDFDIDPSNIIDDNTRRRTRQRHSKRLQ